MLSATSHARMASSIFTSDDYVRDEIIDGGRGLACVETEVGVVGGHGDALRRAVRARSNILVGGGPLRRAYLGVSTQPIELQELLRGRLGIQQTGGLMLLGIEPGAPAERGGLFPGDILLAIGGRTVEDGEALQMALGPEAIDKPTPIRLIRGGALRDITLTPAPRPN